MKKAHSLILAIISALSLAVQAAELPDLGSRAAYELPPNKERELGLEFMYAVTKKSALVNDAIINDYFQKLGQRLYVHAHITNDPIKPHIFIVNSISINAFTGPGGYIGINSGLVLMTQTESELAGVLAHEMAHMTRHHIARMIVEAKAQMLPTLGALMAAVLVGVAGGGQAGVGAINAVLANSMQNSIDFIRLHEYEADRVGIRILQQAGFDGRALPDFFMRLQRHTSEYANIMPEYLRTHPFAQSRIADSENRLVNYQRPNLSNSLDYYIVQARLMLLTPNTNPYLLKAFSAQMADKRNLRKAAAGEYGYALALAKIQQYPQAIAIMLGLMQHNPNEIIYPMGLGEIKLSQRKNNDALAILAPQYAQHGNSLPLLLQYAKTLLVSNQADKARQILEQKTSQYKKNAMFCELLAQAQGNSGHLVQAYQTRAMMFALEGRNDAAQVQLQQAMTQPGVTQAQRAHIQRALQQYIKP